MKAGQDAWDWGHWGQAGGNGGGCTNANAKAIVALRNSKWNSWAQLLVASKQEIPDVDCWPLAPTADSMVAATFTLSRSSKFANGTRS